MQDRPSARRRCPLQHTKRTDELKQYFVRDYHGEADVFLVFCSETDEIYCVPVDVAPKREMSLRVDPSQNGQRTGIRFASEYELPG